MSSYSSQELAKDTPNATAQRILAADPATVRLVHENPYLADDVFVELYTGPKGKPAVAVAKDMITCNTLSDAQFAHVLATEARSSVIVAMLKNGLPPLERLEQLAASKAFSRAVGDQLIDHYNDGLPVEFVRAAARFKGRALLELWLRCPQEFSDDDIRGDLVAKSLPAKDKDRYSWLLATRPALVAAAVRSDIANLRMQAAGCRHLTDPADQQTFLPEADDVEARMEWAKDEDNIWPLIALAHNPVVSNDLVTQCARLIKLAGEHDKGDQALARLARHPDPVTKPFEAEDDMVKVAWLLGRCLPTQQRPAPRAHDLVALLANPHLGEGELARIHRGLGGVPMEQRLYDALQDLVRRYPEEQYLTDGDYQLDSSVERERPRYEVEGNPDHCRPAEVHATSLATNAQSRRWLEQQLGDDVTAWRTALMLLDGAFDGSLLDLTVVAQATAA